MYLSDVYGMFRTLPPKDADGGGGNFSIVLVLLCIIDGLACEVWPGRSQVKDAEKRFKRPIRCKLPWGPAGKGKWVDKATAANQLYKELRNPLVHELARDKVSRSRPSGYSEPVIGKWGHVPEHARDIAKIDAMIEWNDAWPVLYDSRDNNGNPRRKLAAVSLFWAVKELAKNLIATP